MNEVLQHTSVSNHNISFSDKAKQRIIDYLTQQPEAKTIRLSVKKTGCSGLSYVIDYITTPPAQDIVFPLVEGFFVSVDKSSFPYLKGIHIDYVKQGLNQKFVFNNPNQTGQCGCGESFTVD